jgi:pimeloyl-ACP methyl ester carboxylesterase
MPDAKKVAFPGAGHMVNMEYPDEFTRMVLEFLAKIDDRSG